MIAAERKVILKVERGLSILRYRTDAAFALSGAAAPQVVVAGASPGISLVCAPGEPFGELPAPGRTLIAVAEADGVLEILVRAAGPGGSLAAELELTHLQAAAPALPIETPLRPDLPPGGAEFVIRAHVSLRGDVAAPRGHWICGPDAPGRIEGIEMRGVAADLPLEYQVATAGRAAGWSPWTPAGTYAGSRGKALPLIGLRVRLTDGAAPDLVLRGDGVFLGSAVVTQRGREIELVGASPLDPLVGIRLDFASVASAPAPRIDTAPARQPSRLRVFRRTAPREAEAA
ncbi:hypothetical protein [Aureimonas sp. AU12]|uniref:hypothetical protein n=1 Tax=Aureimonas sp. AU12 TaxID=1638161 RepID=UPI000783DFAD|nr:hypothetical protein [Aureimonas sp. AU12]